MKHYDFWAEYSSVKDREIQYLNNILNKHFDGEFDFRETSSFPYILTEAGAERLMVVGVRAPVTGDGGILVLADGADFHETPDNIGADDLCFGCISGILDSLPEPKKNYLFNWDGGDLPRRRDFFEFECDADAMMAARKFMNKHHIDIINVWEVNDVREHPWSKRLVATYE